MDIAFLASASVGVKRCTYFSFVGEGGASVGSLCRYLSCNYYNELLVVFQVARATNALSNQDSSVQVLQVTISFQYSEV